MNETVLIYRTFEKYRRAQLRVRADGLQTVKNPPAMRETRVRFLGWEDPLEEGMTTLSGILAWRTPVDRGTWWAAVHGVTQRWTQLSD